MIRKRYLMVLLVSYMLVLIVPLLTGSFAYLLSKKAVEDEVFRANSAILEQARNYIDKQLEQKELLVAAVALNPRINDFLRIRGPIGEDDRYMLYNMVRDLSAYKNMYPFISDFYIYFENSDMIITPTAVYTPEMFYKFIYSYDGVDSSVWKDNFLQGYHNTFIAPQSMSNPSAGRYITYIRSLPINLNQHAYANLVILIDEQKIRSLLGDLEWLDNGFVYIVDKTGEVIITNSPEDLYGKLREVRLEGEEGWSLVNTGKGSMALSYTSSRQQGWKYVSLMPTEVFMARVAYIKRATFYVFLVSLIAGLILAYLLARRNYFPVKKILGVLSTESSGTSGQKLNEFDYIQRTILRTLEEDKRIQQLLSEQKPIIRNNLILRLLEGKEDGSQTLTDSLKAVGVVLPHDSFSVVVLDPEEQPMLEGRHTEEQWALLRLAISEYLLNSSFWQDIRVELTETDRRKLVFLLNLHGPAANLDAAAKELQSFIANSFGLYCTSGVGSLYDCVSGISKSYSEANRALAYRMIKGHGPVIHYNDIVQSDQSYYYPIETEQQIANCLKAGELGKVEKYFEYILGENLEKRRLSPDMLKFLFSDLVGTAGKVINELKLDYKNLFHADFDPVTYLSDCLTTRDMCDKLHRIFEDLCAYIDGNKNSHNTQLTERITAYVHREYKNPELSLQMIAGVFHISIPYLSRFFKEQTGANLNSYINGLRIEKAKEMLNDPLITINDIARQVGFSNDTSFIRVFKKMNGITPGSYRLTGLERK